MNLLIIKEINNVTTSEEGTSRNSHSSDSALTLPLGVKYINYGEEDQMVKKLIM